MKVFLVDDSPVAQKMLCHAFGQAGYETLVAGNGREALARIPQENPDAVILDVVMPELDGFETTRRLRENPITERIPILLLTSSDQVNDKLRGFEAGADDYVVKPVTPVELIARVQALIRRAAVYAQPALVQRARLLTFLGAKGGVGTTTLAVNVAIAFAQQERNVILVDLHPWAGAVAAQLGISPQSSLAALAEQAPPEITRRMLQVCLERHSSGVQVLTSTHRRAARAGPLAPEQLERVVEHLELMGDVIVFDAGNGLTMTALTVLRCSHFTTIVIEPDTVTLALATDLLRELEQSNLVGSRLGLVMVNRSRSASTFTREEVEAQLGSKLLSVFTPAPEICFHASKMKTPILLSQPNTITATQIKELGKTILQN